MIAYLLYCVPYRCTCIQFQQQCAISVLCSMDWRAGVLLTYMRDRLSAFSSLKWVQHEREICVYCQFKSLPFLVGVKMVKFSGVDMAVSLRPQLNHKYRQIKRNHTLMKPCTTAAHGKRKRSRSRRLRSSVIDKRRILPKKNKQPIDEKE